MPEDGKKVAIVGGLGLVGLGIWTLIRKKKPSPPPPGYANLYGKVTDAVTGKAISDVLVSLDGIQYYTDGGGNYAFTDLEPGGYSIAFEQEGYNTITEAITVIEGQNELNVQMAPIGHVSPDNPIVVELPASVKSGGYFDVTVWTWLEYIDPTIYYIMDVKFIGQGLGVGYLSWPMRAPQLDHTGEYVKQGQMQAYKCWHAEGCQNIKPGTYNIYSSCSKYVINPDGTIRWIGKVWNKVVGQIEVV